MAFFHSMNKRETPNNTVFWKKYAPVFEEHKAQDPQPLWFFKEFLFKDLPAGGTVLDIGCGSGRGLSAIKEVLGHFPMGMDLSQAVLQQAQKKGIPAENLILSNILDDPLPAPWDVIWVSDLLLYFDPEKELDRVLKKIGDSLKKNGRLGLRWSVGHDETIIKNQNWVFLASEIFLQNLLKRHSLNLAFIEQRKEPIYVADNPKRHGRNVFSLFWYVLALKT